MTIPCDRCHATGVVDVYEVGSGGDTTAPCGSCQGQCHVESDIILLTSNEAFIYVCATRYAINRMTYAGGIVIQELLRVIPHLPYNDRKLLETEIADALFRNAVDSVHRSEWEKVVDALRVAE
jgi:hypothetical protein